MNVTKNILVISSSSKTGGGPSHIFTIDKLISDKNNFFYAMPFSESIKERFDLKKFLFIQERKISILDLVRLILFIKNNSIDIIHSHGKGAGVIGRLLKIFLNKPLIYTYHGIHIECLSNLKKIIYISYENLFSWIDDQKIFVSRSEKDYAIKSKIIINGNYSIINNGVPNKNFRKLNLNKEKINKKMRINNNNKNIISICRLVDQKNIFEILRIAKNLESYNFLILGDGYLFSEAKSFLNKYNINNVYLLGNKKNIYDYLYGSDLFLSTSLYEGHPISILEAMSIGLPVVASKVVGNIDTIKQGISGYFYDLGDVNQASKYIKKILSDEIINSKFSLSSIKKQRKFFTLQNMKNNYYDLYKKV